MKLFIWDFHGVLEKGNDEVVHEITNRALEMHGHSTHRFGADSSVQNRKTKKDCLHDFLSVSENFNEIISIGDSPSDMDLINLPFIKGTSYLYSYPRRAPRLAQCHYKIDDLRIVLQEIEIAGTLS